MANTHKDLFVPKEMLDLFQNSVRIIDKRGTAGHWPVNAKIISQLKGILPEVFRNEAILKKFDVGINYKGNTIKNDFAKLGLEFNEARIINNIYFHGIPVPWQLLRNVGIDYKKFDIILTPKI